MAEHLARSDLIGLGRFPDGSVAEIEAATGIPITPTSMDLAGSVAAAARVLLVGEDLPPSDLEALLVSLREIAPSLSVLSVSAARTPSMATLEHLDGRFAWPDEREELIVALRTALRSATPLLHVAFIGWRSAALIGCGLAGVGLWQIAVSLQLLPEYILPGPGRVMDAFLSQPARYLGHTMVTAAEAGAGFLLANALAATTGIVLHRSSFLRQLSLPVLTGLQALPIVALAPLLAVWLGTGAASKVAMASIVAFFPLVANLLAAFSSIDRDLLQLFTFHRANYAQTLRLLLIPGSYPAIIAALRISGGLAVVGAIVAEFTGSDRGLGFLLLNATYRLETANLFVAILLSAALGVIFAGAPNLLRLTSWGRASRTPALGPEGSRA